MNKLLLAALSVLVAAPAWAATVTVTGQFARATLPGSDTAVVYFTLQSDAADTLTGVSSPTAASAMLHKTTMAGMVMSMDGIDKIDLPAGTPVVLEPDHLHIMLEGLKVRLVKGRTFPLHLTFAHAPAMDIIVPVASFAATAPNN